MPLLSVPAYVSSYDTKVWSPFQASTIPKVGGLLPIFKLQPNFNVLEELIDRGSRLVSPFITNMVNPLEWAYWSPV